jgi:hypothetical protein
MGTAPYLLNYSLAIFMIKKINKNKTTVVVPQLKKTPLWRPDPRQKLNKISFARQIKPSSFKRSVLQSLYFRRRLGLRIPRKKNLRQVWLRLKRHRQRSAVNLLIHFFYRYRRKQRFVFRRLKIMRKKFRRLRRGELRGYRFDYPASFERFRWPYRIRKTTVIDPAELWEVVLKKSLAYERIFRSYHRIPHNTTAAQDFILSFLWAFAEEYYSLPNAISMRAPPVSLLPARIQIPSALFSFFWQPPLFVLDQNPFLDHFYAFKALPTFWWTLSDLLWSENQNLFLWQFANREFHYWRNFFNSLLPWELDECVYFFLQHPRWLRAQLDRLVIALPFLPSLVRTSLAKNFRRLARFCFRLHRRRSGRPKKGRSVAALYRPLAYARQRSWFIRQRFYMRRQRKLLRYRPHLANARQLLFLARVYSRLHRLLPAVPVSLLHKSLGPTLRQRRASRRFSFTSASSRLMSQYRRWHRQLRYRKWTIKRGHATPPVFIATGPVYVRYNNYSFFWSLLIFWLLAFFSRFVVSVKSYKFYQSMLALDESFPLSMTPLVSSFLLPWQILASSKMHRSVFRLACVHWKSYRKLVHRRRKHFRRRFRGFFFRSRRQAWRRTKSRSIPRYYRRFKFIRRLPFRVFRVFWPQSANFTKPSGARYRRLQRKARRRWVPRGYNLVQPRTFVSEQPRWGGPRRQLVVGRS